MSGDESLNNLSIKYNRLISEYKSLREKHNLLKNALISERDKTKELESLFMENGIKSRKTLQELESLKFRNEMLSKQANTLREELAQMKQIKSSKSVTFKAKDVGKNNEELDVIKEDLVNKINECSSLHSQLSDLKVEYQTETNNFRSAISDLESQLKLITSQNSTNDSNIRKALAHEIEDRTTLEIKLETKENMIAKLENNEKILLQEISNLQQKVMSFSTTSSSNAICQLNQSIDSDNINTSKLKDMSKCESVNGSLASIAINENLNSNEIYICSLIDKISQLEQKIVSLEMENQLIAKRHQIEKKHRDLYEEYISGKGENLPELVPNKTLSSGLLKIDSFLHSDSDRCFVEFYESKIDDLTKQLYQSIAKAALYYDEAKASNQLLIAEKSENSALREDIELLKEKLVSSQEDLDLTATQYDKKMREMSIHIAELNTQIEWRKMGPERGHAVGDNNFTGNENISSIKGFINSLKK